VEVVYNIYSQTHSFDVSIIIPARIQQNVTVVLLSEKKGAPARTSTNGKTFYTVHPLVPMAGNI